jgi:hypothetical protein
MHNKKASELAEKKGGIMLEMEKYAGDDFMYCVIVERGQDCIVWDYNANDDAFYRGSYDLEYFEAVAKMEERLGK